MLRGQGGGHRHKKPKTFADFVFSVQTAWAEGAFYICPCSQPQFCGQGWSSQGAFFLAQWKGAPCFHALSKQLHKTGLNNYSKAEKGMLLVWKGTESSERATGKE